MSFKGVIGVKNKGFVIPTDMVKRMVEGRSCYGIALLEGTDFKLAQDATPITEEEFNQFQTDYKDTTLAFSFISAPAEGFSQQIIQPFSLVKDKKNVSIMLGFLEGQFPMGMKPQSPHSNEFNLVETYLRPKLQAMYDAAPTSEKFFASLATPLFEKEMEMMCLPEGALMLYASNGELIKLGAGPEVGGKFDWGSVSNLLGYTEKPAEAPKKLGIAGKLKSLVGGKAESPEPQKITPVPTEPVKEQPAVAPALPEPVKDAPLTEAATLIPAVPFKMFTPPKALNNKTLKKLLNQKIGCLPNNYKQTYDKGGSFPIPEDTNLKFGTADKYEAFRKSAAASTTNTAASPVAEVGPAQVATSKSASSTTASNVIAGPKKHEHKVVKTPTVEKLGIVPAAAKQAFLDEFRQRPGVMRAIADSRDDVLHPNHLAKFDSELATFAEQSGLKQGVLDTLGWSREDLGDLVENHKELAVALLYDLQNEVVVQLKAKGKQQAAPASAKVIGLKRTG